jgi:DNA invertase Pin-like site-specific DNA recombinase
LYSDSAPTKPLRPTTIRTLKEHLRMVATVVGARRIADLCRPTSFKSAITALVDRHRVGVCPYITQVAWTMTKLARHGRALPEAETKEVNALFKKVLIRKNRGRRDRDQEMLDELDDTVKMDALLTQPRRSGAAMPCACRSAVVGIYRDATMRGARKDRRGYLALTTDALAGKFQIVVAESLDRLNRDLEETARLYKWLKFVDVGIVTVSEGPISEIHVSFTGLMGKMYVKNLGEKTRGGVEGRVLAGKSGGGRCFGYDMAGSVDANGASITGERKINEVQADVVRDIFRRFAAGEGPRAIARDLNELGIPGPYGRPWGDTTIRGHAKKGTGMSIGVES